MAKRMSMALRIIATIIELTFDYKVQHKQALDYKHLTVLRHYSNRG